MARLFLLSTSEENIKELRRIIHFREPEYLIDCEWVVKIDINEFQNK